MIFKTSSTSSCFLRIGWISCVFFSLGCEAYDARCFYPDGTPSQVDTPCDISKNVSFCCGPQWDCLSNHLCYFTHPSHSRFARGSCTDSTWNSNECPKFCLGEGFKGMAMSQCTSNTFCCGDDCDCESRIDTVSQPIYTPTSNDLSTYKLTPTSTDQATSQSTQETGGGEMRPNSVTDRGDTLISYTESISTSGSSLMVTSTPTLATPSPTAATSRLSNSNGNIKIGLSIGGSVGLSIIAIVIFSFWREHRLKSYMQELRTRWVPVSWITDKTPFQDR